MTTNKSYKKRKEKTPPPRASAYLPYFKSNSSTSHPLFRHTFFELCPDISEYVNSFKTSDIAGSGGLGGWGGGKGGGSGEVIYQLRGKIGIGERGRMEI